MTFRPTWHNAQGQGHFSQRQGHWWQCQDHSEKWQSQTGVSPVDVVSDPVDCDAVDCITHYKVTAMSRSFYTTSRSCQGHTETSQTGVSPVDVVSDPVDCNPVDCIAHYKVTAMSRSFFTMSRSLVTMSRSQWDVTVTDQCQSSRCCERSSRLRCRRMLTSCLTVQLSPTLHHRPRSHVCKSTPTLKALLITRISLLW